MIICVMAAGLLAFTNAKTEPIIAKNEQEQLEAALQELLPEADSFEPHPEGDKVFYAAQKGGKDVGIAAVFPQKGFGGEMKLALGVNLEGEITGFKVLQHSETPGLGARIEERHLPSSLSARASKMNSR